VYAIFESDNGKEKLKAKWTIVEELEGKLPRTGWREGKEANPVKGRSLRKERLFQVIVEELEGYVTDDRAEGGEREAGPL
jgi:hypothetical protein